MIPWIGLCNCGWRGKENRQTKGGMCIPVPTSTMKTSIDPQETVTVTFQGIDGNTSTVLCVWVSPKTSLFRDMRQRITWCVPVMMILCLKRTSVTSWFRRWEVDRWRVVIRKIQWPSPPDTPTPFPTGPWRGQSSDNYSTRLVTYTRLCHLTVFHTAVIINIHFL